MHAHFLVSRRVFWWVWISWCCTGTPLWSLDTEVTKQTADAQRTTAPVDTVTVEQPNPVLQRASAVFAGGCFWCTESDLEKVPGVIDVISGYSGGRMKNPTYETYASGGHREVVFVVYDPTQITYQGLVEFLVKHIDPTNRLGQFQDVGRQYGPAIYYNNDQEKLAAQRVVDAIDHMKIFRRRLNVSIEPRQAFWPAEAYHQNFHAKNLRKYQFYRAASGRDAFLQQHWGARVGQLELDGAFPGQGLATDAAGSSSPTDTDPPAQADAGQSQAADSTAPAGGYKLRETEPGAESDKGAWLDFQKPSPQALRQQLTPLQFRVTQQDQTEPAFQNRYWNNHKPGLYVDVVSGEPLFSSADKFESGTGWPSFVAPIDVQAVRYTQDNKLSYTRIEVRSSRADSHIGHLFNDGPVQRGGKRYCLNSAALRFIPIEAMADEGYAEYLPLVGR